jgi:Tol biopolymer transport system component
VERISGRARIAVAVFVLVIASALAEQSASGLGVWGQKQSPSDVYSTTLSQDARVLAWETSSKNLSPSDFGTPDDVYVRHTESGTTVLASRATGAGPKGNSTSSYPAISADGRIVTYTSFATNLLDSPEPLNSPNGQVYIRDIQTGMTAMVSRATGVAGASENGTHPPPGGLAISGDGRYVAWITDSTNIDPADTDEYADAYVRDRQTNTTTLVSRATGAQGANGGCCALTLDISADGRYVAFDAGAASLDPADIDQSNDVYVRDLETNTTALVTRATGALGAKGNGASDNPSISADGRYVAFRSRASNLSADDPDVTSDVYVRDMQTDTTTLVSRATGAAGVKGGGASLSPSISGDGRFVAFASQATNLSPDDADTISDAFVRDLQENTTVLASRADGASGVKANGTSQFPVLSPDGRYVVFQGNATNLNSDDTDQYRDVYVRDLQANRTYLESRATQMPPRPRGATPLRVSLVPAFTPCSTANSTHGAPLAFPSCSPPQQASGYLTIGTADANGAGSNMVGSLLARAVQDDDNTFQDETDIGLASRVTDVRTRSGLLDYTGGLQGVLDVRLIDHRNGPGLDEPATVQDFPLSVPIPCVSTAAGDVGSTCSVVTSANALIAGSVVQSERQVWQLGDVRVNDGGGDGDPSTGPNGLFLRQGVYAP